MIYTNFSQLYAAQSTVVIQNEVSGVAIDKYAEAFGNSAIMSILMNTERPLTDYIAVIKKAIAVNRERALAALIQIVGQTQELLKSQAQNNNTLLDRSNEIKQNILARRLLSVVAPPTNDDTPESTIVAPDQETSTVSQTQKKTAPRKQSKKKS